MENPDDQESVSGSESDDDIQIGPEQEESDDETEESKKAFQQVVKKHHEA
ncbi:hypothetical protein [uncultured Marinobacter sp.]|nr:hypothetical protein [uncultured Marinobacter sp.]